MNQDSALWCIRTERQLMPMGLYECPVQQTYEIERPQFREYRCVQSLQERFKFNFACKVSLNCDHAVELRKSNYWLVEKTSSIASEFLINHSSVCYNPRGCKRKQQDTLTTGRRRGGAGARAITSGSRAVN
jgi:hypothetical protein